MGLSRRFVFKCKAYSRALFLLYSAAGDKLGMFWQFVKLFALLIASGFDYWDVILLRVLLTLFGAWHLFSIFHE